MIPLSDCHNMIIFANLSDNRHLLVKNKENQADKFSFDKVDKK